MLKLLLFLLSPTFLSTQRTHVTNGELSGPQIKSCMMPKTLEVGAEKAFTIAPYTYFYETDGGQLYLDVKPLQGGTFGEGNYSWIEFFHDKVTLLAKPKEDDTVGSYPFQIIARNSRCQNASQVMIINVVPADNRNNMPSKTDDEAPHDTLTILFSTGAGMVLVSIFSIIGEKSRRAKREKIRALLSKGKYFEARIVRKSNVCTWLFGISDEEYDKISAFVLQIGINKYNQRIESITHNKRKKKEERKKNLYKGNRSSEEALYEGESLPMIPENETVIVIKES